LSSKNDALFALGSENNHFPPLTTKILKSTVVTILNNQSIELKDLAVNDLKKKKT
jgi:hypothetical protein